eukprot:418107_1
MSNNNVVSFWLLCTLLIRLGWSATMFIVNSSSLSQPEILLSNSVSGLYANQLNQPSIWLTFNEYNWNMSEFWLDAIKDSNKDIIYNDSFQQLEGLISITKYLLLSSDSKFQINGYLKANLYDASLHYALSLAFHYKALISTDDITSNALENSLNLKLLRDFTKETQNTYTTIFDEFVSYNGNTEDFIIIQELGSASNAMYKFLPDFAIASKSFIFYDSNCNSSTVSYIFGHLSQSKKGARLLGWGCSGEFSLVNTCSEYNISLVAANYAENMAQFYVINDSSIYQQHQPKHSVADTEYHYVTFVWSDGDNLQWLINGFFWDQWYGSKLRGNFPVSWTLSGSVQELAPIVYDKIMSNATSNDSFVMGPSGWSYQYINDYNNVGLFARDTANAIGLSNDILSNINLIDDWKDISSYSNNVNMFIDAAINVSSVLYYWFTNYACCNGKIFWHNDVPIITGKLMFWEGINNYTQIANALNSYPVNIKSEQGYSLIPVHVWSQSMQNVSKCIELLNPNVKVVGINEFVKLIKTNVVRV